MRNRGLIIAAIISVLIACGLVFYVCCDSDIKKERNKRTEQYAYEKAFNMNTIYAYDEYLKKYPNGKHAKNINERKTKILEMREQDAFDRARKQNTEHAWQDFLKNYPEGKCAQEARNALQELKEMAKYTDNSLSHGSQPYAKWYGRNSSCNEWGCSEIKVTAPASSDVVVLIKRNNRDGRVVRHAYIAAGRTYTFELPNGTYQTFFYYGRGWYPNKAMDGGVRGGFLKGEIFSKDDPQYLENNVLSYVLQLQKNGNFSTKSSSQGEMF